VSARFKIDENLPRDVDMELRREGHDVRSAIEQGLGGGNDGDLLAACRAERRILVTLDVDFGDVRAYPPANEAGIWVLRPTSQSIGGVLNALRGAMDLLAVESAANRLWIVQSGRVRIRQ
jgi:predicted nuclease of predicted toxin-antitoxin system